MPRPTLLPCSRLCTRMQGLHPIRGTGRIDSGDKMAARTACRLMLALMCGACGTRTPPPRHRVPISGDTLRADHLGAYGNRFGLTPAIEALAADSQRFSNAYAPAPITLPSVTALLTGRYPDEIPIRSNLAVVP